MPAAEMVFKKDGMYTITPTKVLPTAKVVNSQRCGQCFKYILEVVDDDGMVGNAEYLCKVDGTPEFEVGVRCQAACIWISDAGTPTLSFVSSRKSNPDSCAEDAPLPPNQYTQKIGGSTMAFAMGFAKDLLVAEISRQELGYRITDADLQKMSQWADMIADRMSDRINF